MVSGVPQQESKVQTTCQQRLFLHSGSVCLDPSVTDVCGQLCSRTEKFKVQIAMYRVAAWSLGPSGQWRPRQKVQSPKQEHVVS